MKHLLIITLIFLFTFTFGEDNKKLGEALTLDKSTNVSTLLNNPDPFLDERVQITGTIVDVCAHRGCWIEVAGDQPFQSIIVKVNDGEIIFPLTAKGHQANVEGTFEKLTLTDEQALKRKTMLMEEAGETFDPEAYTLKPDDRIIYRLKGLGAEIQE